MKFVIELDLLSFSLRIHIHMRFDILIIDLISKII